MSKSVRSLRTVQVYSSYVCNHSAMLMIYRHRLFVCSEHVNYPRSLSDIGEILSAKFIGTTSIQRWFIIAGLACVRHSPAATLSTSTDRVCGVFASHWLGTFAYVHTIPTVSRCEYAVHYSTTKNTHTHKRSRKDINHTCSDYLRAFDVILFELEAGIRVPYDNLLTWFTEFIRSGHSTRFVVPRSSMFTGFMAKRCIYFLQGLHWQIMTQYRIFSLSCMHLCYSRI